MPTINVFYHDNGDHAHLAKLVPGLKATAARELSGSDINLAADEISVRLIKVDGAGMLADVELEITAHAFDDRVARQDQISLAMRAYVGQHLGGREVRVWLLLPQLGHSWEAPPAMEEGPD